jgi:hypothetical protein
LFSLKASRTDAFFVFAQAAVPLFFFFFLVLPIEAKQTDPFFFSLRKCWAQEASAVAETGFARDRHQEIQTFAGAS